MRYLLLILSGLFLSACSSPEEDKADRFRIQETATIPEGQKLLKKHCNHCHSATAAQKAGRVAPPMIQVKAYYMEEYPERQEFINAFVTFSKKPSNELALLKDAVQQFGLMPYQSFPEADLQAIAAYIYDYKIDGPDWFPAYWEEKGKGTFEQSGKIADAIVKTDEETEKDYAEIGLEFAQTTKAELGKNLMGAMQEGGTMHALKFCNEVAIPLTDSMSKLHKANIRRVSDRNRNPDNAANEEEASYIALFQEAVSKGQSPDPIVRKKADKVHFYYPIVTNSMCLNCHGNKIDLEKQLAEQIIQLYPNDKAVGYAENEVRGIWSITFNP